MTMSIKPDDDLAKIIAERVYSRFGHLLSQEESAKLAPEVHRITNETILSGRPDGHPAGLIGGIDVESASGAHAALDSAKVPRLDGQGEPLNLYGRVQHFIDSYSDGFLQRQLGEAKRRARDFEAGGDRLYGCLARFDRRDLTPLSNLVQAAREGWERSHPEMAERRAWDDYDRISTEIDRAE